MSIPAKINSESCFKTKQINCARHTLTAVSHVLINQQVRAVKTKCATYRKIPENFQTPFAARNCGYITADKPGYYASRGGELGLVTRPSLFLICLIFFLNQGVTR